MRWLVLGSLIAASVYFQQAGSRPRARDLGIAPGALTPGPLNAITDVDGVRVGHVTIKEGDAIRTGVTAILPHGGNLFQQKVAGAVFVGNAFGKLAGSTQVQELETNDGTLNDIRGQHVMRAHVIAAISGARTGAVEEGAVGAGTGTIAFGWKGGIGTSSRTVRSSANENATDVWTVGVLVQTNYGGKLVIDGVPVWKELTPQRGRTAAADLPPKGGSYTGSTDLSRVASAEGDGSCMIVVAT